MAGRAAMRTPEPPDRDEREDSPPRLSRPKRTTRPPNNYAREQEIDNGQRRTRSQQKNQTQTKPEAQRDATTSGDSSTDGEDLSTANLVKELVKLREEIRRRDELHREELQKVQEEFRKAKEEFGAALAGVRHELQTLTDGPPTPPNPEAGPPNHHDEILREIQSLREEISVPASIGSPSYADVARTPPLSHPSNIRTLSTSNTTPTTFTDTLYCTIDTSEMAENENTERTIAINAFRDTRKILASQFLALYTISPNHSKISLGTAVDTDNNDTIFEYIKSGTMSNLYTSGMCAMLP
ncbi:hypothetical protein PENFLA_c005G06009 [Penicillium flavigenum]|uniref:Uncharacterized protein n=1 Tax=Penicillium flavigenum TaxID=254877 RepID=A0A1V6TND1_9EURO|nr:hypothetical protein PENFLA_c005G06009 [Penicillium flavigenum]